tara:strand:- start:181 stop:891 length:711 start_codon:yes stop_codon:yes gene_type:complete
MIAKRELILDTETTGLDVESGDRIIEIGIIELIDSIKTGNDYHALINPEKDIDKSAQRVHGISNDDLKDKPKFSDIVDELMNFLKDSPIIIHNADFDRKFLDFELENCGRKRLTNEIIDTLIIARKEFPSQSVSLDSLCKKLKIDNTNRDYHSAIVDADLLSSIYLKLTSGKQAALKLNSDQFITKELTDQELINTKKKMIAVRKDMSYLPEDEYDQHKKFIKEIKSSVWRKIQKI